MTERTATDDHQARINRKFGLYVGAPVLLVVVIAMAMSGTSNKNAPPPSPHHEDRVKIGATGVLTFDGGDVILFKSQGDMDQVIQLRKAGADAGLLMRHIACIVPDRTKVLRTATIGGAFMNGLLGTSDVLVLAGPHAGCEGVVDNDRLSPE